jgi:hypothetical protein
LQKTQENGLANFKKPRRFARQTPKHQTFTSEQHPLARIPYLQGLT